MKKKEKKKRLGANDKQCKVRCHKCGKYSQMPGDQKCHEYKKEPKKFQTLYDSSVVEKNIKLKIVALKKIKKRKMKKTEKAVAENDLVLCLLTYEIKKME